MTSRVAWHSTPTAMAHHLTKDGPKSERFIWAEHIDFLGKKIAHTARGHSPRLIVAMPPRHGKSHLVSLFTPVWFLENFPHKKIILCSYEAEFAASWGRKVRDLIKEKQDLLRVRISESSSAAHSWETNQKGGMFTAGVGGPVTGKGADLLLVDDPIKNAEEAHSETYREKLWDWWVSTAYTRLEPGGAAIVMHTRWHEDDLAGRLIKNMNDGGEPWEVLTIPGLSKAENCEAKITVPIETANRLGFFQGQRFESTEDYFRALTP